MRILIVGAGMGGSALLRVLHPIKRMKVIAIVDLNPHAKGLAIAEKYNIETGHDWRLWIYRNIDIIIEATGNKAVLNEILEIKSKDTIVIPGAVAYIISTLLEEKEDLLDQIKLQINHQTLILNNIRDGMIVINEQGFVKFINRSAEQIVGLAKSQFENQFIGDIIANTRLPHILKTRRREINQKLTLKNGKQIITTRIPLINNEHQLIGAFAVFKDITEVVHLAEENTDLKEIKTMLEAIFKSSEEAISVVDENGLGLMINPAYSKITGLHESAVIGESATIDISEGESMHLKVLRTRKPVRGVPMKVGPSKKEVLVNAAPVIVDNKVKGSVGVIHDVSEIHSLTNELKKAKQMIRNLQATYTFNDIIGPSPEMTLALEQAKLGAKTPATVLLRGESGTGKELFAHAIHNESDRKHNKFIRVNCAAIAESILESELFGYEDGAFSGAKSGGKKGLFEEAHMGSIFLDEIGEISLAMQTKLLRVLQEGEIVRVGGTEPISIDVRVIAATNLNLEKAMINNTFREDLYYRLNRLPIFIPSLKERLADLPYLIQHFIYKINQDYGKTVQSISKEALAYLKHHHWPGNIRELENVIARAMIFMKPNEEVILRDHISDLMTRVEKSKSKQRQKIRNLSGSLKDVMEEQEKNYILHVYEKNNYNKTLTAKELDVSIRTLYYKLDKFNVD